MKINKNIVPLDRIESKIYFIRGKKVMLDKDLADLYQVETRILNQAVKRNLKISRRFLFSIKWIRSS